MAKAKPTRPEAYPGLMILEDISTLISHSHDLQDTLNRLVQIVAERMETEVCSLYILEPKKNRLTLWATTGLDEEAIGKVSMGIGEGLTGLVIEKMSPVMAVDAQAHPRSKHFPETGEERFHSFLGVPLIERRMPLGVLVVQTSRRREFSRDEIRLLRAISAQVSGIIIQKQLGDALKKIRSYEGRRREGATRGGAQKWRGRLTGLSVAPGFGRGKAFLMKPRIGLNSVKKERAQNPKREIERFRAAVERGMEQLQNIKQRMSTLISTEEGAVFDAHRLIIGDPVLIEQIESRIRKERCIAEYAVSSVFAEHLSSFSRIEDEYLRERAADVKDVAQRLLESLSGLSEQRLVLPPNSILVAEDLLPADLSLIEGDHFRGIVLATGGVTSHASILAKSFEIPTVVAVEGLLENVRDGDSLIIDGNSGVVYIN